MLATIERLIILLSRLLALCGALALTGLVLLTVASITGRALAPFGARPIAGDFELVEAGLAFAVFAFLPWCSIERGHARVTFFSQIFPARINRILDSMSDGFMLVLAIVLLRQHVLGMLDKRMNGETSFILQYPLWWAYAGGVLGAALFVLVAALLFCRNLSAPCEALPSDEPAS